MQGGADAISRSAGLDDALSRAHQLAVSQGHGAVALEHLLFALTDDPDAVAILAASNISVDQLRTDASGHLGRLSETAASSDGSAPRPGADLLRILQLAGMAARQSQRRAIDGAIVLAAIVGDGNSSAAGLLKAHGLTFEDVIRVLQTVGAPRQQELAPAPVRAELPPPAPPPAQASAAPSVRAAPRPSAGDDVLEHTRARVRQAEPPPMRPLPPPPPPVAEMRSPPPLPEPRRQEPSRQEPARVQPERQEPARAESLPLRMPDAPAPEPPPRLPPQDVRSDVVRPDAAPIPLEPAHPRAVQAEPITVPVTTPHTQTPVLAQLRASPPTAPNNPMPPASLPPRPPAPERADLQRADLQRPDFQRPDPHRPVPHRPVPAVMARPQQPQPMAPPPGGRQLMPQRPDLPPLPPLPAAPPLPPPVLLPSEPLDIVRAAAGLPAIVRRNTAVLVEIRIPRSQIDVPRHGPLAPPPHMPVARAVTTRLASGPVSGLSIEPRTPETAWLGPADADTRDVVWQYVLLPTRAGTFAVTLSIAGRTMSPAGMTADTATAAETFAVRVKPERGRFTRRLLGTLLMLGMGGAIGWALTGPLSGIVKDLLALARG